MIAADPDEHETVARLSFHGTEDSTEVHLSHGLFKTQARCLLRRDGSSESFATKLSDLVTAQRQALGAEAARSIRPWSR